MADFGAGAIGRQLARAHGHLPLAVLGDAEIHPEAAPSPLIASAFDLQAIEH